jgi:hypothetical protein
MREKAFKCDCETCRAFARPYNFHWPTEYGKDGFATKFWHNPKGPCGICNDDRSHEHVKFVPNAVAEFFGTRKICEVCRNTIQGYVRSWRLCWSSTPDWALKWALAEMVFQNFQYHFSSAFGRDRSFKEKRCCKVNHGR